MNGLNNNIYNIWKTLKQIDIQNNKGIIVGITIQIVYLYIVHTAGPKCPKLHQSVFFKVFTLRSRSIHTRMNFISYYIIQIGRANIEVETVVLIHRYLETLEWWKQSCNKIKWKRILRIMFCSYSEITLPAVIDNIYY